ncbi:MAG: hypothetical protein AAFP89_06875 [Bacteroidota bacterium]
MRQILLLLLFLPSLGASLCAQSLYLSRIAPGFPGNPEHPAHRISIFNEASTYQEISGYTLVTRSYVVVLPAQTFVRSKKSIDIGFEGLNLNIHLDTLSTLIRKQVDNPSLGDYVALFDQKGNLVDALYYGPSENVAYLPEQISANNALLLLPTETNDVWEFMRNPVDPAVAFVRINRKWRANSRTKNLIPATNYRSVIPTYQDGIVTLDWKTMYEYDCFMHLLERSIDGKNFQLIRQVPGVRESEDVKSYREYDSNIEKERVYYYRVTHVDKFGEIISSNMAKVRTEDNPSEFSFEILKGERGTDQVLNVRFASVLNQQVRIKLLDEELREIAILFYDDIDAYKQNLVTYQKPLPVGKYFVILSTEEKRYYEPFIIE